MKKTLSILVVCLSTACGGVGNGVDILGGGVDPVRALAAVESSMPPQIAVAEAPSLAFNGLLNETRLAHGAGALVYDSRLAVAAKRHADDMVANNIWAHVGSDGTTVGTRVSDAGYNWLTVGENLARGFDDQQSVMDAWMASDGHRQNNINPSFEDFALAKADSPRGMHWVLVMAREQP